MAVDVKIKPHKIKGNAGRESERNESFKLHTINMNKRHLDPSFMSHQKDKQNMHRMKHLPAL